MVDVYEFAAAEWGFGTPRRIRRELTDELLQHMLDSAADRLADRYADRVEAVRIGMLFTHPQNKRAHERWQAMRTKRREPSLSGDALEAAVAGVAAMFPGNVIHEVRPS